MARDPEPMQGAVTDPSPSGSKPSRPRWQKVAMWCLLAAAAATPVVLYYCRGKQTKRPPGSLSEAASSLGQDFPQFVVVPPTDGTHLGKLVKERLGGRRLTLQPLTCFHVSAPREEPSLNEVEVRYTADRDLALELGGEVQGVAASAGATQGASVSVHMKLEQMRTRTGVGIPDQVACDFKDGVQLDVVTSEVIANSVTVTSEDSASQRATVTLAKLSKTAQGWKAQDSTRITGQKITVFADLTRMNVQLTDARHDLGARPVSRSVRLGTGGTTATVTGFDFGQRLLTIRVANDTGQMPDVKGRCGLNEPIALSRTDRCAFVRGPNASVLLSWEIEQQPYRKVILVEKLLRTTVVSPAAAVASPVGGQ